MTLSSCFSAQRTHSSSSRIATNSFALWTASTATGQLGAIANPLATARSRELDGFSRHRFLVGRVLIDLLFGTVVLVFVLYNMFYVMFAKLAMF